MESNLREAFAKIMDIEDAASASDSYFIFDQFIAPLVERLESAIDDLRSYAMARRDQSFDGWEYEWREIPIKHESDYEHYPNHITKEEFAKYENALSTFKKKLGVCDESN